MNEARRLRVSGTVQGVGFRPFVARLAEACGLSGWVLNGPGGVEIHVEGARLAIETFSRELTEHPPSAARIDAVDAIDTASAGFGSFVIRDSAPADGPTAWISPDLPTCDECLHEMFDPAARRFRYPYINCTNCGPRFSIIQGLPYDRVRTTMASWTMCDSCAGEYHDAHDRRFHAEPTGCPACGPHYALIVDGLAPRQGDAAVAGAADLLRAGALVAIKGIGGYHLSCDAANNASVAALRERKYRKAKPFAVMARDLATARRLVRLDAHAEHVLMSAARPIVLAPAEAALSGVAPDHRDLGVMLPYAPVHHLLFAAGAPNVLVMTSANVASEPIAIEDDDARRRLTGIADAFLTGERRIARRVDDSVVRAGTAGLAVLRRARGYAPSVVARLPEGRPILATGADLKNTVTLVIAGSAIMSQHVGDLEHFSTWESFRDTVYDFKAMYGVNWESTLIAHDSHPLYSSASFALNLPGARHLAVQHHRAHVASVLAEHAALDSRVVGIAFDGTGHGDDGSVWGGEFFVGSVMNGLRRVASIRPFALPGGDAAARHPTQALAGVLADMDGLPDLTAAPFGLPRLYSQARALALSRLRTFSTTSAGRLFDAAAALLGFRGSNQYEAQAAAWLEQRAWRAAACNPLPFEIVDARHLDFRPALRAMIERRAAGVDDTTLARAFHETVAEAIATMARLLCQWHDVETIALSGGTFQNALLLQLVRNRLAPPLSVWTNINVPPNDGGISLGQAAIAACVPPTG